MRVILTAAVLVVLLTANCASEGGGVGGSKVKAAPKPAEEKNRPIVAQPRSTMPAQPGPAAPPPKMQAAPVNATFQPATITPTRLALTSPPPAPAVPSEQPKSILVAKPEPSSIPKAALPAKAEMMVVTAPPVPLQSEPSGSLGVMIGIGASIVILFLIIRYRGSESGRIHRRMREIIESVENTLTGQKELLASLNAAIKEAATAYLTEVRRGYMMAVSIDEVRKLTPGVRLKPLHDRGLNNLLAVQGWDASRFLQLRGIGPDSAGQIAAACAALTKSALSQPVGHPRVTDSSPGAQKLFRQVYFFGQAQESFAGQDALLGGILKEIRSPCETVGAQTTFFRWLFGSEKKGELQAALEAGVALEAKLAPSAEMGQALADAQKRLSNAGGISRQAITAQGLAENVSQHGELYRTFFERLLGTRAPQSRAVVSPVREDPPAAREPVRVRSAAGSGAGFSIEIRLGGDTPPDISPGDVTRASECWLPPGQEATVGSFRIRGGMIYVGRNVPAVNGRSVEPALIDPKQPISGVEADCHTRMLNYWSSYSYASPAARASYLQWLASGRSDPEADVGYVFLYLYGLERRVLADATADQQARAEIPAIMAEVRRLRSIYQQNGSFNRYSGEFMDYVEATHAIQASGGDGEDPPPLTRYQLTFGLRRKLGQLAAQGQPLPVNWAYTWYHNDPRTRLPAAAERCPMQTAALFAIEYERQLGAGLVLPANKTRLKITYRPASASFGGSLVQSADLPDVSVLTASYAKLDAIGMECFRQLDGYSRYLGRNKDGQDKFEAVVLLPISLWPATFQAVVADLTAKARAAESAHVLKFQELLGAFGQVAAPNRTVYLALCRALGAAGMGVEPDTRFGGEVPEGDDAVALFLTEDDESLAQGYGLAALLLRLAAAVAAADGEFSEGEAKHLQKEIQGNVALGERERQRLRARLARYRVQAPPITGLKPTVQQLGMEVRAKITDFLLTMIYADRSVAPGEVKLMEKIYVLFGMEPSALYTRLHELSAGAPAAPVSAGARSGPLQLNAAKVQQLRAVSDEVTKKLAVIFDAENAEAVAAAKPAPEEAEAPAEEDKSLLALDAQHADLLTLLVGRTQWTRAEFEEVCADKGLMPDGAIERINDAAFTKYDQAIIEGEDPLEIAVQLLEEPLHATNHPSA